LENRDVFDELTIHDARPILWLNAFCVGDRLVACKWSGSESSCLLSGAQFGVECAATNHEELVEVEA